MNKYQLLYIIDGDCDEEKVREITENFSKQIEALGGKIESREDWNKRKFAYPINGKTEGYYVLVKFSAGPDVPAEIDRQMRINDKIARQMITRI